MISRDKTWFLLIYGNKLDKWTTWKNLVKDKDSVKIFKNLFDNILKDNMILETTSKQPQLIEINTYEVDTFNFKSNYGTNPNHYFELMSRRYNFLETQIKLSRKQVREMANIYNIFIQEQCMANHKQVALIYSPMLAENASIIDKKLINDELLNCGFGIPQHYSKIHWFYYKSTIRWPHTILGNYNNKWCKEYIENVNKNR